MRWTPGGTSSNIEDRRGEGGGGIGGGGGGGFRAGGPMGIGGALIVLVLSLIFGGDIFSGGGDAGPATPAAQQSGGDARPVTESAAEKTEVQFVSFVLDDAQKTWSTLLPKYGGTYRNAKLVLFRNAVSTACGDAPSAAGPFYCPMDQKVYLDLGFFDELKSRFGANGDFAQAYVITHELGHHVQRLLGTESRVRQLMEQHPDQQNELSVRLELQADCFAGVWANTTDQRQMLEQGDAEEALGAAAAVGDDRIQEQRRGSVHPESFTHGSSTQRVTWFKRGFSSGDPRNCDTFAGSR